MTGRSSFSMRIAIVAVAVVLSGGDRASACVCMSPSPKQAYKTSDAIFVGQVVSRDGSLAELETSTWFKGKPAAVVTVWSPTHDGDCGYGQHFTPDSEHLVFAYLEDDVLKTTSCSRTRRVEDASCDLALLARRRWWWRVPLSSFTPLRWLNLVGFPAGQACSSHGGSS